MGKTKLLSQQAQGLSKHFICFKLGENRIPREHFEIVYQGQKVGEVTSGGFSPVLDAPIGMGYVEIPTEALTNFAVGSIVQISIRNKFMDATIVDRPFYKR
jgi:aminomethyltransferase